MVHVGYSRPSDADQKSTNPGAPRRPGVLSPGGRHEPKQSGKQKGRSRDSTLSPPGAAADLGGYGGPRGPRRGAGFRPR